MAYVGIKLFRLFTKTANPKIQGMLAGVMFQQISYNTLLGLEGQYPYGPYCTWNYGRNPIFTQVTGVPFRLMIKPGMSYFFCSTNKNNLFVLTDAKKDISGASFPSMRHCSPSEAALLVLLHPSSAALHCLQSRPPIHPPPLLPSPCLLRWIGASPPRPMLALQKISPKRSSVSLILGGIIWEV